MFTGLLILQVVLGLTIIVLVLLQQGKGADMGAAFGAGSSGAVFGAGGGGSFFTRATAVLAAAFFINSVLLSTPMVRGVHDADTSVTERIEVEKPAILSDLPDATVPAPADAVVLPPADDLPEVPVDASEPATDTPPQ